MKNDLEFGTVIEFSKASGLNFATALDCLRGNAWDAQAAMRVFESLRAQIPAEAFVA